VLENLQADERIMRLIERDDDPAAGS